MNPFRAGPVSRRMVETDMQARKRVRQVQRKLPVLVESARATFEGAAEQRTAVLIAWAALAGVIGWTPEMVAAVEKEMGL